MTQNPQDPQNSYFMQFNLPRHLELDLAALEKAFYSQSRKLHPDRFASRPQSEQEAALAASSRLNDAYRTLKDPIARTEYLLALEGIQLEEQSRAATDAARATGTAKKQVAPPDLLEEAFELNMQLEEMKEAKENMGASGISAETAERLSLEAARTKFTALLNDAQQQLESLWSQWDAAEDANDSAARERAKQSMVALLNRRRYIRNLVRDVNAVLE